MFLAHGREQNVRKRCLQCVNQTINNMSKREESVAQCYTINHEPFNKYN